jgi:hypothetical protein
LVGAAAVCVAASTANASQLIARDATNVKLAIDTKGEALITYMQDGQPGHVLVGGAIGALRPDAAHPDGQVKFWTDYSGGWDKHGPGYRFAGVCKPYTGPSLPLFVAACKAPDGTFWALQQWQRALPDYGVTPTADQAAWELRLSHWSGPLPVLQITTDWVYGGRFDHLFGSFTYAGTGVYGFKSTPRGVPLDSWGRNLYVDAYDSPLGPGWQRDNSFVTHKPKGTFCYGFFRHAGHPAAKGTKYRATIEGPGVTPDIMWQGAAPGTYDPAADAEANTAEFAFNDPKCKVK